MTEPFHWNSMVQWPDSEAASEFSSTPFPQVLTQLQEDHDSHPKFPSMPFSQILSPPLNEDYNMFSKPTLMPFSQVLTSPYKEDYSSHSQPALMPFSQVLTLPTNEQEDPMPASTCTEVSTIFCLSARWHSHHGSPDIVLFTSDSVLFHVHSHVLLAVPDTGFHALIPSYLLSMKNSDPVVHVPESSSRLNIILHAIYNMPCSHFSCPLQDLSDAVDHFALYGMVPRSYILKNSSFYNLLLSYVPHLPLDVYTFASKHELEDLAVSASFHLLSFNLSTLTEEMAKAIGPSYLRRLFFLQIGRSDALKRLLLNPPSNHTPTASCDINDQRALTRAWALASAYLVWDSRPDLSSNLVEATFTKLVDDLSCDWCKKNLNERINNLSVHWSHVKCTI